MTEMLFLFRIGVSVKQQFTEEEIYKDRDSQISAIEKTFEDAQKSVSGLITRNAHHSMSSVNTDLCINLWLVFRSHSTTVNPELLRWRFSLCSLTSR